MREKISIYVEGLFSDAALTIRNAEVQQEILQHALDRYDDLIAAGKSEQEAYDEAVGGIGDVSELYEHRPAAEAPKKRDFPAPPAPDAAYAAPETPKSGAKKKLPGWAIALICVGVAAVILALNFAGRAVYAVLHTGEQYIYDNAGSYETLDRSGFGSGEPSAAASELLTGIREIEIHWLAGDVYLAEPDADGVSFQEDYTGDNEDYRMRYKVSNGKLTIQPCKSKLFGSIDLPRKALTVFLPDTLTLDKITVETVSADVELMGGSVDTLSINTTSGNITGPGLSAKEYELGTVSGDISLTALPAGSSAIDCETVSGEVRISCTAHPDEIDFNSVSGNLRLTLPKGSCRYTLDFSTVSGDRDTDRFISGGDETCDITAETVSGNVELQTEP